MTVSRHRASILALAAALAACGDEQASGPAPAVARPPAIATSADPAGRITVATVNGEPVFADCVATQASAAGIDLQAALQRCIDFELLAQEAVRRGLLADREVLDARRTEMVRALVEQEYATTLDEPGDVPAADLKWLWDSQLRRRYNKPERRRATYCRAPVVKGTPAGGPEDQRARKLAEGMHAALSAMRNLEPRRFASLCWMVSGGAEVKTTAAPTRPFSIDGRHDRGRYADDFAGAAFTVAAVGGVSRPTRTSWGWDVVLVTEILPAEARTFEQAEPEMREMLIGRPETAEYRNRKFQDWVGRYLRAARVEVYPDNLPDDQALAQSAGPAAPEAKR